MGDVTVLKVMKMAVAGKQHSQRLSARPSNTTVGNAVQQWHKQVSVKPARVATSMATYSR